MRRLGPGRPARMLPPSRTVLVVRMLRHMLDPQSLGLLNERSLSNQGQLPPVATEQLAEVCVVNIRVLLSQPPSLSLRPDHEGIHRASYPRFHPLRTSPSLVAAAVRRSTSRVTPSDGARRRRHAQRGPSWTNTAPPWHTATVPCVRGPAAEDRGYDGPGHHWSVRHAQLRQGISPLHS